MISRKLMKDLYLYAEQLRGERAINNPYEERTLFLTERGEPWSTSGKGLEAMVRNIGNRVGIRAHPHMLRHTYATHTLVRLQRAGSEIAIEPLVFLQQQLGHASIETTMVYLHVINELADNAVLTYDMELDDWPEFVT